MASLLILAEDVFSEDVNKEAQADLEHVLRQASWPPAKDQEKDSSSHTPWSETFGKCSIFHCIFIISLYEKEKTTRIMSSAAPLSVSCEMLICDQLWSCNEEAKVNKTTGLSYYFILL